MGDTQAMSVEDFNKRVFARIDEVCSWHKDFCKLEGTIFPGNVNFERYKDNPLPDDIYFNKAEFFGEAMFFWTTFGKDAHFDQAKFHKNAAFYGAKFGRYARFVETKFDKEAWFDEATFGKDTGSEQAEPGGDANFNKATFGGEAKFNKVTFGGEAEFKEAKFGGKAVFEGTRFSGKAKFEGAKFDGEAGFKEAAFGQFAWFFRANFGRHASFHQAKFDEVASFDRAEFKGGGVFRNITAKKTMDFRECLSEEPMRFIDMDLYRCDFLRTDMTNIHFLESCWPLDEKSGRYRIAQEDEKGQLEEVKNFYQAMKRKYKQEHNEAEVSKWHLAEKEVQLELMKNNRESWFLCIMLCLYRFSCRFGEDPLRAFWVLFLGLVLLFLCLGAVKLTQTGIHPPVNWDAVGDVFQDWLRCLPFSKVPVGGEGVSVWKQGFSWFMQALISIQAALFAFALRNKFRR
ncbi:MAG: pentapeptide repeat-containing protein [Thermodesulfobacteriota bacterium]|nr:pentapeptide repeat-containing protein [Thermodesulfobacteriota bacterium]